MDVASKVEKDTGGVASQERRNIIRRLYDWVLSWADTPYGLPALICVSFLESSIFPIPPDVLLIALVLGKVKKWWQFAFWCAVASVSGGLLGYGIGVFSWELLGKWIVENLTQVELVTIGGREDVRLPAYLIAAFGDSLGGEYLFQVYDKWNAWIVLVFGLTPLPYKLVTITAGVAKVNLAVFMTASIVARTLRFFLVAWILRKWGEKAKDFIDRYFNLLCVIFVFLLIGGFIILKFIL
ncbi:DedA family protein [candidate division KSB1 bacterium]|nr:DedA family protein [candidate division KSB1 bacterium]NIR70408.1 DedA family protein [candidate division KSB1 bacterium]NIS25948.1 DedA family protein [candidate division KSB1 bacterium]NIT69971.1 DedA family protein [candidate division KSB1 bacterium]NIU26636.1 DedA family protein [candidate division KSB1 bacterium]